LTALLLFGIAADAAAQQEPRSTNGTRTPAAQQARVDVQRLPVNLRRIQRELAQETRQREERDGLNLRYIIDVFGQAPPIEIFTPDDNLIYGPVPYGAPTHQDMIYMMTPPEFRSPVMDFGALFRRLSGKDKK
jgi:hypothetical protein